MGTTANEAIRQRTRARRLRIRPAERSKAVQSARERRESLKSDAERAREQRIDEAIADVALAWELRSEAEAAVRDAEAAAADALTRLRAEKISQERISLLTGLDRATVRRLRANLPSDAQQPPREVPGHEGSP